MEPSELKKEREILRDKIYGLIFGAALGDAVGLATEFMNKNTAKTLYGDGPIKFGTAKGHEFYRDGHRSRWHENDFTDDTDQLLLILQCLLSSDGHLIPEQFAYRLREWTKIGFPELSNKACCGVGFTVGSVIGHDEFLTDPHKAAYDVWQSNKCNLAANGAVMRTSVLGIPLFFDELQVVQNSINCAKVTHVDPRCVFSAVVVSVIISRMIRMELGIGEKFHMEDSDRDRLMELVGNKTTEKSSSVISNEGITLESLCKPKVQTVSSNVSTPNVFQRIWQSVLGKKSDNEIPLLNFPKHKPIDQLRLETPVKCSNVRTPLSTDSAIMTLVEEAVSDYKFLIHTGNEKTADWNVDVERLCPPKSLHEMELDERSSMGYTLKTCGSALFCFSRQKVDDMNDKDFFMRVITELTLEAGDADTNAAVAGALLGCRLDFGGLPSVWLNGLRHREFLIKICDELLKLVMNQLNIFQSKDETK